MKKSSLKPTTLRSVFVVLIFIIIIIMCGGFYYAQDQLYKLATENETSGSSAQTDTQLMSDINSHQTTVEKANSITASNQDYQSQIMSDLNKYATATGVSIASQTSAQAPLNSTSTAPITGVQINYVSVTLNNPVSYTNLIKFLKAIETNLPKMQLTGISITPNANTPDSVSVEPLIIKVYTK